jgi:TonB family protein
MSTRAANSPELVLPVVLSGAGHVALVGVVALAAWLMPAPPPRIDPRDVMEVSMVVLPKSATRLPERAMKAQVARGDVPKAETPAPIRESDLKIHEPEPELTEGVKDREIDPDKAKPPDRAELLKQLALQDLLADAPDGPFDRLASDPNATSDEAISAMGRGSIGDPEWARYQQQLQQLFMAEFSPLPTIGEQNPGISCIVSVEVEADGTVTRVGISTPSGNASYDGAAERAAAAVPKIPLPPERFRHLLVDGFDVRFVPPRR